MKRHSLIFHVPLAITFLYGLSHPANAEEDPLAVITASSNFDNSVPAILNYAQQEQGKPSSGSVQVAPKTQKRVQASDKKSSLDTKYSQQQGWLTQKDATIRQLQMQLADKNAQEETFSQKEEELTTQIKALQTQLGAQKLQNTELADVQKQSALLEAQLKEKGTQLETLTQKLNDNQQQHSTQVSTLQEQLNQESLAVKAKEAELAKITSDFSQFKDEAAKKSAVVDLKLVPQQQAYSIGVSLGNDVLQELNTREAQGVKVDRDAALLGISDVFKGTLALDESTRNKSLAAASQALYENLSKAESQSIKEGKLYQQKFAKQKGVEFKEGVYSKIDYAGQEAIEPEDTVVIVMKETLTDGTVITDMDAAGKVWSQPLSAYPPIFSGPLKRLGNHGSITVVVPPDLAYGSKGLPPKIPPGATMTYSIRVVDVIKKTK
ncbi:FKBP-type peptidyl-prolyl cis-trans isomerase N-terminal domain-containing protein [Buttiauxella agrestis]|uniref:peptidylprolyl isomerase n=1 Tax=Buttiauxella agrestis ATCC 33320 TaxID=1006004 RepID=A0A085GJV6_9ENTR|nr:FKBP-type peptidyl-prolyl cis-trans isomerase N-terminal domain-containing protein [Buttiauxella agrestis]KFC84001.1 FKBP-type peptidyl-prolyl cis-trans isomerase [Buttiauxella agrestis ATCC 33320]